MGGISTCLFHYAAEQDELITDYRCIRGYGIAIVDSLKELAICIFIFFDALLLQATEVK